MACRPFLNRLVCLFFLHHMMPWAVCLMFVGQPDGIMMKEKTTGGRKRFCLEEEKVCNRDSFIS